jgi:two-component system chemotaxis response regulator CheB
MNERKTKILIVDDSAIVRKLLSETLSKEPDLEVVGTAPDPYVAQEKISRLHPDVLTLDIEMPRMDGLTFLKVMMREHPLPVVVISSLAQSCSRAALEAMEYGAVEVVPKPGGPYSVGDLKKGLPEKIRAAARSRLRLSKAARPVEPKSEPRLQIRPPAKAGDTRALIAIGASTGGTEALREVLMEIPADCPPIAVVQHIPAVFSKAFADRLDACCQINVKEAADGDVLKPGGAWIAPGNFHLSIYWSGGAYRATVKDGPQVCYQRPAVDVLFNSVAEAAGQHATAALLTGMGSDGANGMLKMKQRGARTIAQDEESCVVFGMPREAIRLGAADEVLPLDRIARALLQPARPRL